MKIIDLHCDTLYKVAQEENYSIGENNGHITDKSLRKGGYLAQCFAIYTPADFYGEAAYDFFKKQYCRFESTVSRSEFLDSAKTAGDIRKNLNEGKVSAVLTVENAEFLNGKPTRICELQKCGVKVLGLIHNGENCLGFPHSTDKTLAARSLKPFGREVAEALNGTDIAVDVSHLNYGGFCDVAEISKKPFIATHSACRNLYDYSRNLYDAQIKQIANSGGVVGLAFYSKFLNGSNKTEIEDILRHLEHLINVGGAQVAAFGTDFDGMDCELFLKTAAEMPLLVDCIIKKFGFSTAEKICYKNALRVF